MQTRESQSTSILDFIYQTVRNHLPSICYRKGPKSNPGGSALPSVGLTFRSMRVFFIHHLFIQSIFGYSNKGIKKIITHGWN